MEYKHIILEDTSLSEAQRLEIVSQLSYLESAFCTRVKDALEHREVDTSEPILSDNAKTILAKRYLLKDPKTDQPIETPVQMFARVALKLALVDLPYEVKKACLAAGESGSQESIESEVVTENMFHFIQYYNIMRRGEFIPAGRTLANEKHSVPNCIVLHPTDSMEGIFQTLKDAALLQKAGCGLGFPLHLMRPTGMQTVASGGTSSGPISFLHVYNTAFAVIKQQSRHGANMAIMRVDHPDILEFVHCKQVEGDLRNFNISVGLTNDFMEKVKSNDPSPWKCQFKDKSGTVTQYNPRRILRGPPVKPRWEVDFAKGPLTEEQLDCEPFVVKIESSLDESQVGAYYRLKPLVQTTNQYTQYKIEEVEMTARQLFEEILHAAWRNGEPGCVFLDRVNETNPLPHLGRIESSNPCGEQFLHDGDVCNLGSVNMAAMVKPDGQPNMERIKEAVRAGIRMLDNVVDTFRIPVDKVQSMSQRTRRCGLGIMGFGEYLLQRGIPYDSQQCLDEIDHVMGAFQQYAVEMTRELAEEKGVFPEWEKSIYGQAKDRRRNAFLTSIAPTGTISMTITHVTQDGSTGGISSGCEPVFAWAYYKHNILGGMKLSYDCNVVLQDVLRRRGIWSMELLDKIVKSGTIRDIEEIPEDIRRVFRCAQDISGEWHVKVQARLQRYIDNAISKTCNFPNSATVEDIMIAYVTAWSLGCKGLTVYRDGSRTEEVLGTHKDEEKKKKAGVELKHKRSKTVNEHKQLDSSFDQGLLPERAVSPPHGDSVMTEAAADKPVKRRYYPQTPAEPEKSCPDCRTEALQFKEGCVTCSNPECGWSKCQ